METVQKVDWSLLIDKNTNLSNNLVLWSTGELSTRQVIDSIKHTSYAGEFRKLVRSRGTVEARRLARKALRYRGILQ